MPRAYETTQDILNAVLFHAGELTDGSSEFAARALDYINRAYRVVWTGGGEFLPTGGEDWWWLRSTDPGVLTLEPAITTLLATVNQGSTSVTFNAAPTPKIDTTVSKWHLRVTGVSDVFRIQSHLQGQTSATLDGPFTGSNVAGVSCTIFKLEYSLPSTVMRLMAPMRLGRAPVSGYDAPAFDRIWPVELAAERDPDAFAFLSDLRVRFNHYPPALRRVEFDYVPVPADLTNAVNEKPLVPLEWRHLLVDGALYFLFLDKSDARADAAALRFKAGLGAMMAENRRRMVRAAGARFGRVAARTEPTA